MEIVIEISFVLWTVFGFQEVNLFNEFFRTGPYFVLINI